MTKQTGLTETQRRALEEDTEPQKETATFLLLELLQLLQDYGGPFYAGEDGDLRCYFCREWQFNGEKHEPDCIYVRAENLLQKTKGEN